MAKFGSPLEQLINDLDTSANRYFCFNSHGARYAIKALEVWEICGINHLYLNMHNEPCLSMRGRNIPAICVDGVCDTDDAADRILICSWDKMSTSFGLIVEGNPELKIATATDDAPAGGKPYISEIARFQDENVQIIAASEFYSHTEARLAKTFDQTGEAPKHPAEEKDSLSRLEYAAYNAELLARNASIEAAHGMGEHKGTMVVAYELHQLAAEIAKIAHELREYRV